MDNYEDLSNEELRDEIAGTIQDAPNPSEDMLEVLYERAEETKELKKEINRLKELLMNKFNLDEYDLLTEEEKRERWWNN